MSRSQDFKGRSAQSSTLIKNQLILEAGHLFPNRAQQNWLKGNNSKRVSPNLAPNYGQKIGEVAKSRRSRQFAENINQIISLVKEDLNQGNRDIKQTHDQQRKIADLFIPNRESFLIIAPQDRKPTLRNDSQRNGKPASSYLQFPRRQLQMSDIKKAQSNQYQVHPTTQRQIPINNKQQPDIPIQSRIESPDSSSINHKVKYRNSSRIESSANNNMIKKIDQHNKNYLSNDAITLIEKIQNRALHQIQILKNQKRHLVQLLNEEVSKHNESKMKYVQLQTEFTRLIIYLENQGIRYVRSNEQAPAQQSRELHTQRQQRFQQQRAIHNLPQNITNRIVSPIHTFQKQSQNYENQMRRNRASSNYVSGNKNTEKYTGFGLQPNMNQKDTLRDIQIRLKQAQNQAQTYQQQLQRLRGSMDYPENFHQNVFELLNQGQRIREDTMKLLKIKSDISKISGIGRNQQLQRQLEQQEASKIAFFNDLRNFKDKYQRLEEQNKHLRGYSSIQVQSNRVGQSHKRTNAYESMLQQMKRVTSG